MNLLALRNESQHAETIEERGGHHIHVQESINILEREEDNTQDTIEEEAGEGGEGVCILMSKAHRVSMLLCAQSFPYPGRS